MSLLLFDSDFPAAMAAVVCPVRSATAVVSQSGFRSLVCEEESRPDPTDSDRKIRKKKSSS
jgi:hypothetical protein